MTSNGARRPKREIEINEYLAMTARVVRSAGKRVAEADADDLAALVQLRDQVDQAIVAAVAGLRRSGHTWEEIGAATGTTRQAAIMKWSKKV